MDDDFRIADKAIVAQKNADRLSLLVGQYGLFIPAKDYGKWRPTEPTSGWIEGLWHLGNLTCIATDGLEAFFVNLDDKVVKGHVDWFKWDVEVVSFVPFRRPDGTQGYFKSVKDHGAPGAYYRVTPVFKEKPEGYKPKRKSKSLADKAADLLRKLRPQDAAVIL